MVPLASAGYYVVALDQRGYGRTVGWDADDLNQFTLTNLVRDLVVLVYALGYDSVHCVVGHDFGAVSSSMCALMRGDLFKSLVMMSHPFKAPALPPFGVAHNQDGAEGGGGQAPDGGNITQALAALSPARKHYKWYNSSPTAAHDWENPPQGMQSYLRGYLHLKSAGWAKNDPHALKAWSAEEIAQMPEYYIMPLNSSMPEVVSSNMQGEDKDATTSWMSDMDLAVYVHEWSRTGFQGALNWYRCQTNAGPAQMRDPLLFAGKKIEVPSVFISGEQDWGNYQQPGALEQLPQNCIDFKGVRLVKKAGHWPQQEQAEAVVDEILGFLRCL